MQPQSPFVSQYSLHLTSCQLYNSTSYYAPIQTIYSRGPTLSLSLKHAFLITSLFFMTFLHLCLQSSALKSSHIWNLLLSHETPLYPHRGVVLKILSFRFYLHYTSISIFIFYWLLMCASLSQLDFNFPDLRYLILQLSKSPL